MNSIGIGRVEIVCNRCGGYGVTLLPGQTDHDLETMGKTLTCDQCGGVGHYLADTWEGWRPKQEVLDLIATYSMADPLAPREDQR